MARLKKQTPGEGGSPYQPYKPKPSGPYVPAPKKAKKKKRDKLKIAQLPRLSGSGDMTNSEFKKALKIINSSSPNELIRKKREKLLIQQAMKGV
tara:strand:- start:171 stop:452 length:282 start_codon:yes stop_codon:yes gene_type:complete